MARDKITVDLLLATKQAEREIEKINRKIKDLGKTAGKSFGGMGGGADKVRALGTGLSKATVKADEFSKSLEASNARVIAFGASAGIIMGVERALKAMVVSAIKVEKAMMDVSVVMQVSTRQLDQFGKGMFRVAKETAQGFDVVAEAATELARQGLGMEKTLARTKDALILTRLTGMSAADAVKSLTAAVNSFNKEGVTSADVINRMAKVDAAFAVSSDDLAKAISRVGASAISAGVGMNELMAITTAVQQKTARGGAVIGNAFKTIFTRIQRSDVQKKLRDMGISATDNFGRMKSGMVVLQNMADGFDSLTKSQQASLAENVAGVFQVNILKAALSDLSAATSHYKGALDAANSATNEAYQRNEQLNQTLDALTNRTLVNLTKAGASIGGATLEPAIRKILNSVNSVIDAFSEGGRFEKFGSTIGEGLLSGIGNFIKGPGLIIVGTAFMKLGLSLAKFAGSAFKDLMGLNVATKQRVALEEAVIAHIASEPALLAKVRTGTLNVLAVEKDILATVRLANAERLKIQAYARPLAGALVGRGMRAGSKGATMPGGAAGFVPNFASPGGERAAAAAGGYRAGSIRTMQQPGAGTMMYNSAETVKQFPGMSQSAIMPPQSSPAGAGYRAAFGGAHGFDPYAGRGFVPNFNLKASPVFSRSTNEKKGNLKKGGIVNMSLALPAIHRDIGIITETGTSTTPISFSQNIMSPKEGIPKLSKPISQWRGADGRRVGKASVKLTGVPLVPVFPIGGDNKEMHGGGSKGPTKPGKYLQKSLDRYSKALSKEMFGTTDVARSFDVNALSQGTLGDIFEEGVRVAVGGAGNDDRLASFDYMGKKFANTRLIGFFNRQGRSANLDPFRSKIEAKIGTEAAKSGNIPRKMINDPDVGYDKKEILNLFKGEFRAQTGTKGKHLAGFSRGFVPNFSSLSDAVGREVSAGVPASAIRVGSSPALRGAGNPGGVGVYNTIHEPGGLTQGISRSRAQGINPKSHGVPNYAVRSLESLRASGAELNALEKNNAKWDQITKEGADSASKTAGAATKFEKAANGLLMASMMLSMAGPAIGEVLSGGAPSGTAAWSAGANILSMGVMGLAMTGGNPLGAAGGLALGAITSMGDLKLAFGEEGQKADAKQIRDKADLIAEGLEKVTKAMNDLANVDFMTTEQKIAAYSTLKKSLTTAEGDLVAGGEHTKGALSAFRVARSQMGGIQDYTQMTPKQRKDFAAKSAELIKSTRDKATSTMTAASQGQFDEMFGGAPPHPIANPFGKLSVAQQALALAVARKEGNEEYIEEGQRALSRQTRLAFTPKIQADLANMAGLKGEEGVAAYQEQQVLLGRQKRVGELDEIMFRSGELGGPAAKAAGVRAYKEKQGIKLNPAEQKRIEELNEPTSWMSGREMLTRFTELKNAGKGREATEMLSKLFRRGGDDTSKMADALDTVLYGEGHTDITDADFKEGYSPTSKKRGKAGLLAMPGNLLQKDHEQKRIAYGIMQMVARGQEAEDLPMFFKGITDQKPKLTQAQIAAAKTKEQLRQASIMALYDPIEQAGVKARGFGFELQSNVAGRRRGIELGRAGRARQAQLAGATGMFGNELFEETGRLNQIGAFDTLEAAQRDISDVERLSVAGKKETAAATYLKVLKDKKIETGARGIGEAQLGGWLEAMTFDEKRDARDKLRMTESFNETEVGAAQIAYLTTVIDAETKARETAVHKGKEAVKAYDKQNKEVDANVVHLKKMKEAARHFYEGIHVDTLKDQRSKLKERIVWEEKQVELGKLSAKVLHESNMKLADFNRIIDGTGNHLKLLDKRFQEILTGSFSEAELVDAAKAGKDKLNQQIRGRQEGGLGATAALRNAQAAYDANLITSSELRTIKANARLNTPGATGNPMEAFRDQFLYNGRDVMLDFESGVINVADTMKSSFSQAFRSLTSGASTAKEAFAGMAVSILDSISDMSSQMATKMLFNQMFGASKGGLVPRYNSGGVVTGGSGHKDDVLSMMSGGEYVIKKSSAQKIGYGTLDAINSGGAKGYAVGGSTGKKEGPGMGTMFAVSAGASAISGLISQQRNKSKEDPWRGQDYGFGRGEHGYFGGSEYDAGGVSSVRGGGRSAQVSLDKRFGYYRRDPQTGRLISERARPTEGRYEVSSSLSLMGRLNEDSPQTSRMSGRERTLGSYQDYLFDEKKRREEVIKAHEKMKKGRLISAYANAAMLIGGSYLFGNTQVPEVGGKRDVDPNTGYIRGSTRIERGWASGGAVGGGSPAMLTGGEYVMSPDTVRSYGANFMQELNRGDVPGMASGGFVGSQSGFGGMLSSGATNNNVSINVNVDNRGSANSEISTQSSSNVSKEGSVKEAEKNKQLGMALKTVVLQEIIKQQRPGGLLQSKLKFGKG